jgi:hypothetical protein
MVGASAPSTIPTNWTLTTGGLTFTVIGTGTEDGLTYIEINATGTASASNARIGFDSATQILGATGQYWTNSFYFKKVSETAAPDSYAMAIFENTSAGSLVVANVGSFPATTSLARYSYTVLTSGGATVARVQPFVRFSLTVSASYNFTFRIAATQMEQGDIATQFIPTSTAAVSVGPLANIPRIDYLGGGCGKLLLEPQRTNLQTFSENIDNAVYGKTNVTISANATTSPDGYSNADKIVENTTNAVHRISGFGGVMSSGTTYTSSFFAKKAERDQVYILIPTSVAATRTVVVFNLTTGVSSVVSGSSATSHSMVDYGNGWYRCIATFTTTAVGTNLIGIYNGAEDYAGTTDFGLFLYGLMNEAGSYASSYVPTLAASVTRGADSCSKQNIAGTLPTAYPFTLYAEGFLRENNDVLISINDIAQSDVYYQIGATAAGFFASARNSTTSVITTASGRSVGTHKVAAVFTSSEIRLFANGALIATGANAQTFNASANDVLIGQLRVSSDLGLRSSVNQALVFKSALSDADCIALTA